MASTLSPYAHSIRRGAATILISLLSASLGLSTAPAAAAAQTAPAPFDTTVAQDAIVRIIGAARAAQIDLVAQDRGAGQDSYKIAAVNGRLQIRGTTPGTLLAGFGYYLFSVANADYSINGQQMNLPTTLVLPTQTITRTANVTNRFVFNDTNEGYAGAYLDWPTWQQRIDALAMDGFNEFLVYEGADAVYEQTFEKYNYSPDDARGWIPLPAHQPWWLMQNISAANSGLSEQLIARRVALAQNIINYIRSLGLTPVLPGYFGTVPTGFAAKYPSAHVVQPGSWNGFTRPGWLDPTTDLYAQVAADFYAVQTALYGPSTMYKMDFLQEGGSSVTGIDMRKAAIAVQKALNTAHPGATWVMLNWDGAPTSAVLQSLKNSPALVLDGESDTSGNVNREQDFQGVPYAFGTIWNFGGHTTMGASITDWNTKYYQWLKKTGSKLQGVALMPEAIDNNPAAVKFFSDLAWESGSVDINGWFDQWATARYGRSDPSTNSAWERLASSVYDWPEIAPGHSTEWVRSLFVYPPSLTQHPPTIDYDPTIVRQALDDLLAAPADLRNSSAYTYDLVDVARQVLDNDAATAQPQINAAYNAKDSTTFTQLTNRWLDKMSLMNQLVGTASSQLFGTWQNQAVAQAATTAEAQSLREDVRSLVTIWDASEPNLGYAGREWKGLLWDYYPIMWGQYFKSLQTALATGQKPVAINWDKVTDAWVTNTTDQYASAVTGDAYQLANEVATAVPLPKSP